MEKIIKVSDFVKNGLTETNGLIVRKKIEEELVTINDDDILVLNFENITLFATPFFNSSIGYFIMKLGKDKFDRKIKLISISELGMNTYKHSYDNAVEYSNKELNTKEIGDVIKNNIEES